MSPQADTTAQTAARAFGASHPQALMLAYCPQAATFYRWAKPEVDGPGWVDQEGDPPPWSTIFELRAFDSTVEMRWVHQGGGEGTAVQVPAEPGREGAPYRRRLWGQADHGATGPWVELRESRIGSLVVPRPAGRPGPGGEIALVAVERRGQDEHGNWSVLDERLVGMEWVQ